MKSLLQVLSLFVLSLNLIQSSVPTQCCHQGFQILSSGYCKLISNESERFVALGSSNLESPCPNTTITITWNYQTMINSSNSFIWNLCNLNNSNFTKGEQYYQIGDCGDVGTPAQESGNKSILEFSSGDIYYILSCMRIGGPNSYSTIISSVNVDSTIIDNENMCRNTGGNLFGKTYWSYGIDQQCNGTNATSTCVCPSGYNINYNSTVCPTKQPSLTLSTSSTSPTTTTTTTTTTGENPNDNNNDPSLIKKLSPLIVIVGIAAIVGGIAFYIYKKKKHHNNHDESKVDYTSPLIPR